MNKYRLVNLIENFAPIELQEKWDSSGWVVETAKSEIKKVLIALTVTEKVVSEAIENKCDMIISHHPLFFVPLKYNKINIYCAHTNFDKAKGGTTDILIKALQMQGYSYNDFVRIVELENILLPESVCKLTMMTVGCRP